MAGRSPTTPLWHAPSPSHANAGLLVSEEQECEQCIGLYGPLMPPAACGTRLEPQLWLYGFKCCLRAGPAGAEGAGPGRHVRTPAACSLRAACWQVCMRTLDLQKCAKKARVHHPGSKGFVLLLGRMSSCTTCCAAHAAAWAAARRPVQQTPLVVPQRCTRWGKSMHGCRPWVQSVASQPPPNGGRDWQTRAWILLHVH